MGAWLVAAAGVCIAIWLYTRWLATVRFWADRGVPYLPPHPILGNLTFLQKINPSIFMRHIYDHFRSPYVGVWWLWRPALIVNCPEIIRNILVKDSANFRNRYLSSAKHDPIGSLNIFTSNDPLWSNIRRRLTPAFTSSKLRCVQLMTTAKSKELVQRLASESKKGRFDIKHVFNDFTTDVIGIAAFGVKSDATLTGDSPIRVVTRDFEKYSLLRGLAWSSIFFFPEFVSIFRFFPKHTTDYFRKIFHLIVKQRSEEVRDSSEARDLLDILLKIKKDSIEENDEISDDVIIAQAAIFLQGGFDTSGNMITFVAYELAHKPEVQEKLYKELKGAEVLNDGADFDENTLAKLPYLNCVIKEGLRKYAPMGWMDRIPASDYAIDDKLTIPAGTPVYLNAIGLHYDPQYFPDPKAYNPERFLQENDASVNKFTFMPFGEGPRNCIGQRFAYQTIRTALSAIVLHYQLRAVPGTPVPNDVMIERNGLFLAVGEPLYIDFVPRN